jgi:hypothetical protein
MTEDETRESSHCEHEGQTCFCMGAGPELFSMFKRLGPDSARRHFRNARVEMLKGMRELIDKRIADLAEQAETKGTKVPVE